MSGELNERKKAKRVNREDLNAARIWWNGLQEALNASGCEIDLTAPEDTSRLSIFNVQKNGPNDYEFTHAFALDPDQNDIDYRTIKRKDIFTRQKNDQVTDEMIFRMYDAAKQGLLFVITPSGAAEAHDPRQVLVGQNGLPYVGNDINHMTPEESEVLTIFDEPKAPNDPGKNVREKAAANDVDANKTLNKYNSSLKKYNENKAIWDRAMQIKQNNPGLYQRSYNLGVIMQQYFGDFSDLAVVGKRKKFMALQSSMHKEYQYSKLTPEQLAVRLYADKLEEKLMEHVTLAKGVIDTNNLKGKDYLNDELLDVAASLIVDAEELNRAQQALTVEDAPGFKPMTEEERNVSIESLRTSDAFLKGTGILSVGDFDSVLFKQNVKEVSDFANKFKNKVEQSATLVENEGVVRPLFEEFSEDPDPRETLWKNLEDTLNAAGFEVDFNSPEDLARLVITDIADGPNGRKDVSMHYATDSQRRVIDQENITPQEIIARQKPGIPDMDTIRHIKEAAAEGRLFIQPHMNQKNKIRVRQVFIAANDTCSVGSDIDELEGDEMKASRMTEAPKKPANVSFGTRFLAAFGNRKATQAIADYNANMTRYNERSRLWNEIQALDKKVVTRTHNFMHATQGLFFAAGDEGEVRFQYDTKLTDLHKSSENRKLGYFEKKLADEANSHFEHMKEFSSVFLDQYNARILPRDEQINDINAYNLAGMIVSRKKMIEAENHIILNEAEFVRPGTDDDLYDEIETYYNSDAFRNMRAEITNSVLADITDRFFLSPYSGLEMFDRLGGAYMPKKAEPGAIKTKAQKDVERTIKADINKQRQRIAKGLMALKQSINGKSLDAKAPIESTKTILSSIMIAKAEMKKDSTYLRNSAQEKPHFQTDKKLDSNAHALAESADFKNIISSMTVRDLKTIVDAGGVEKALNALNSVYVKALKKSGKIVAENNTLIENAHAENGSKNQDQKEVLV